MTTLRAETWLKTQTEDPRLRGPVSLGTQMEHQDWLNQRSHDQGVVELQLGHTPRNALTVEFLLDFQRKIIALDDDPEVRAIILSSPFKDFSIGVDTGNSPQDSTAEEALNRALNTAFLTLYACSTPVIASVRGEILAEGLFFVLASDLRVAHARSAFEFSTVAKGKTYPAVLLEIAKAALDGNTQRRLLLTGQRIGPIAARNAQFVEVIADDYEDLERYTLKEASKLAQLPGDTFSQIKLELRREALERMTLALAQDPETATHWLPADHRFQSNG